MPKMGPMYDKKTPQGELPELVTIKTKLEKEGCRPWSLADFAEQVMVRQGILKVGGHISWNPHKAWDYQVEGMLPDGRGVRFWFTQQREYVWEQSESEKIAWGYTAWHSLDNNRHLPTPLRGEELIEYRFSGLILTDFKDIARITSAPRLAPSALSYN